MATISIEQLRRRFLECMVCFENFDEKEHTPHTLPCYHVCCYTCLQRILQDGQVKCPTCKASHVVKQNDVKSFHKDNTRRDLLDFLSQMSRPVPIRCTNCEEYDAETRCDSCKDSLCCECTKAHKRTKVTSKHELTVIQQQQTESDRVTDPTNCQKQGHTGSQLNQFCTTEGCGALVCELCCRESHVNHCIKPVHEVYENHKKELSAVVDKLKSQRRELETSKIEIEQSRTTLLDNETSARQKMDENVETCKRMLEQIRDKILNQIKTACQKRVKSLETELENIEFRSTEILNLLSLATQTLETDEISLLKLDTALKLKIGSVLNRSNANNAKKIDVSFRLPDLVQRFQEMTLDLSDVDNGDVSVKHTNGIKDVTDNSGDESVQYQSTTTPKLCDLKSYSTENSSEISHVSTRLNELQNFVSLRDTFSSLDALQFACSPLVSSTVQKRFETWDLIGEWEHVPNQPRDLVMHSRSNEEAMQCLEVLKETIQEKIITVSPETMVVLQSDKWQGIIGTIRKKYSDPANKVDVFVDNSLNKILCYSLNSASLKDVEDSIRIFLRDNGMKVVTLKCNEELLSIFRKDGQQKVRSIQSSLSQFCVSIKDKNGMIEVKGIGIGIGKALLEVNAMLKELLDETDEERFSSDDEEATGDKIDDSLSRFGGRKLEISEILMNVSMCKFHGIYMIGDDRMVFVCEGDLTTFRVDALVNAADKRLRHDGGLAKAIVLKGGFSIQAECSEHVFHHGELKVGDVFVSQPGVMECHSIIHAVGPVWRGGTEDEKQKLFDTVTKILTETCRRKLGSVVIPALCTGKNKFPPQESALCITNAVKDFFDKNPRTMLRAVYLCGDGACVQCITDACDGIFGVKDAVKLTQVSKADRNSSEIRGRVQATLVG